MHDFVTQDNMTINNICIYVATNETTYIKIWGSSTNI